MNTCWLATWVCCAALSAAAADETSLSEREEAALNAAARNVSASVVGIETIGALDSDKGELSSAGRATGLVITTDGYIVCSLFQFTGETSGVLVTLADGTRVPAKLVARDFRCRLALLKVQVDEQLAVPSSLPAAQLRVGQWAVAIGRALEADQPNISVGVVSGLNRIWGNAVQTDAKISPNNYGGPLVDIHGRVIGVLTPMSQQKQNSETDNQWYDSGIGFAVPLEQVMALLPRWQRGSDFKSGVLGVALKQNDMFADPPIVASVRPNSPASKAGLKTGDQIIKVGTLPIEHNIELTRELNRRYSGDSMQLTIRRGKEEFSRDVILVDELAPYARAFLGVLAVRSEETAPGLAVRYVFEGSPAAKAGVKTGDRLMRWGETAIAGRTELAALAAAASPGDTIKLELMRDEKPTTVEVKLVAEPEAVPASLPALADAPLPPLGEQPPVGVLPIRSAVVQNDGTLYVPEDFDHRQGYGLLLWLHGDDGFDADSLLARWREICRQNKFVLLAPRSVSKKRWKMEDFEPLKAVLDHVLADYQIDPLRIAVHGQESGGAMATVMAFQRREQIRGLALVQSPIFGKAPENDPEYRLSFFVATPTSASLEKQIKAVRELKYPVIYRPLDAKVGYLTDAQLTELLRWFDSLDRI